ncbi:MAG TPA: L-threonylcarbamoyladenylate synthase [Candidatus Nitrosocosmicus sp.]|nr:L-threonylcarbamoyladenylate synthase [Candidatus Nitrosocosmicus sp.]
MKILKNDIKPEKIIKDCITALKKGELLVLPSDTVYGLAVDAKNEEAVEKLIKFKQRPPGKAISIYVENLEHINQYVSCNDKQLSLIKKLAPGPFTFVIESKRLLVRKLEAENGTLGVRFPDFEFIQRLVQAYGSPITSTSANLSTQSPHYSVKTLLDTLPQSKKEMLDVVVDLGVLPRNKPSTVVDLTKETVSIIRQGDINVDEINFHSKEPSETQEISKKLIASLIDDLHRPIVILIEGELGVGKTIFTQGMGEYLNVKHLDSPSYVIYNEYDIKEKGVNKLVHFDLYNIQNENEFNQLGIDSYLYPGNILCFEWGEKAGYVFEKLKNKANITYIKMEYINESERRIIIHKVKS